MKKNQNIVNDRFVEYFRETFFKDSPEELARLLEALTKPLPKTIRVNTNRISVEDFKKRAEKYNWILTPTDNPTVFRIDRTNIKMPLGHTLEHLLWYFYIQELSASMSVHYLTSGATEKVDLHVQDSASLFAVHNSTAHSGAHLSRESLPFWVTHRETSEIRKNDEIWTKSEDRSEPYEEYGERGPETLSTKVEVISNFLILDMAASPGGKTTQLTEHFPGSIIIANEPTRDRMAQLVQNTERMGNSRIAITNYDGGHYRNLPETFDRILLDAPCSGEGIGFKESQTVKYWNLKNIHTIARLQTKLLDAAFRALKTGGELLYSTCTLNKIENEGVVNAIRNRFPESFEVLFEKRFWPHEAGSGGFFVCKIRKNSEIIEENDLDKIPRIKTTNEEIFSLSKNHEQLVSAFTNSVGLDLSDYMVYEFKKDVLAIRKSDALKNFMEQAFTIRLWERIGRIEDGVFTPDNRVGRDFSLTKASIYEIRNDQELDNYLRWEEIGEDISVGYHLLRYDGLDISIESLREKTGKLTNTFPKEWLRR